MAWPIKKKGLVAQLESDWVGEFEKKKKRKKEKRKEVTVGKYAGGGVK